MLALCLLNFGLYQHDTKIQMKLRDMFVEFIMYRLFCRWKC